MWPLLSLSSNSCSMYSCLCLSCRGIVKRSQSRNMPSTMRASTPAEASDLSVASTDEPAMRSPSKEREADVEKPPENLSHIEIMYSQAADKKPQNICKSAPRLPLKLRVEYRKILVAEFSLGLNQVHCLCSHFRLPFGFLNRTPGPSRCLCRSASSRSMPILCATAMITMKSSNALSVIDFASFGPADTRNSRTVRGLTTHNCHTKSTVGDHRGSFFGPALSGRRPRRRNRGYLLQSLDEACFLLYALSNPALEPKPIMLGGSWPMRRWPYISRVYFCSLRLNLRSDCRAHPSHRPIAKPSPVQNAAGLISMPKRRSQIRHCFPRHPASKAWTAFNNANATPSPSRAAVVIAETSAHRTRVNSTLICAA